MHGRVAMRPAVQSGSDRRIGTIRVRVVNVRRGTVVHIARRRSSYFGRSGDDLRRRRARVNVGKLVEIDLCLRIEVDVEWMKFARLDLRKQFLEVDLGRTLADVSVASGAGVDAGRQSLRIPSLRRCGTRFARLLRGKIVNRVVVRQNDHLASHESRVSGTSSRTSRSAPIQH